MSSRTPYFFGKITEAEWAAFHLSFGRFMHSFASAESSLNVIVSNFVQSQIGSKQQKEFEIIRLLTGEMRVKPIREMLLRLLAITEAENAKIEQITQVLDHLSAIQFLRDRLMHNAAKPIGPDTGEKGWFETTNITTVRERRGLGYIAFTLEMLDSATFDLCCIPTILGRMITPECFANVPGADEDQKILDGLPGTWQYKPSLLRQTGPKFERNPQSRERRPRPSRE
jgi:hypothetical protein